MDYEPVASIVSEGRNQEMTDEASNREEKHPSYHVHTEVRFPVLTVRNLNRL